MVRGERAFHPAGQGRSHPTVAVLACLGSPPATERRRVGTRQTGPQHQPEADEAAAADVSPDCHIGSIRGKVS